MYMSSTINKIRELFADNCEYYPCIGVHPRIVPIFTPLMNDIAKVFFNILNNTNLEYFIFAGTAVGYVRNGNSPPWLMIMILLCLILN